MKKKLNVLLSVLAMFAIVYIYSPMLAIADPSPVCLQSGAKCKATVDGKVIESEKGKNASVIVL